MNVIQSSKIECEMQAAEIIAQKLNELASKKEHVVFGICGGTSVKGIFSHLLNKEIQWNKIHIFMVDERCVSLNSLESNYKLAYDTFIHRLIEQYKLPQENAHPFIYDSTNAYSGLKKYENIIAKFNRKFDLILLSAGEDGHVAALYPNHRSISNESTTFFMMNDSPKPPKDRMTSSRKLLQTAQVAILLFFGQGKQQAFEKFNNSTTQVKDCPAKLITSIPESYVFRGD